MNGIITNCILSARFDPTKAMDIHPGRTKIKVICEDLVFEGELIVTSYDCEIFRDREAKITINATRPYLKTQ